MEGLTMVTVQLSRSVQVLNKVLIYKQLADPTRVLFIYFLQVSVSILKQVKHHGQPSLLWSKSSISSKVNFFMQS